MGSIQYVDGPEPRILVRAPYNEAMVNGVKQFKYRRWISANKQWEVPADEIGRVIKWYPNESWEIAGPNRFRKFVESMLNPVTIPNVIGEYTEMDFEPMDSVNFSAVKTALFPHQKDAVLFGLRHPQWLLGDKMGMGKSLSAMMLAIELKRRKLIKHALIVCGVNSLKYNWLMEIGTHTKATVKLLGSRKKKDGSYRDLGNKERAEDLRSGIKEFFWVLNIEALRSSEVVAELQHQIRRGDLGLIIVDEIHRCANPLASQTKGLLKLNSTYKMGLTGTPLVNHPLDLYTPMKWLGVESGSWWSFRGYYGVMGGYLGKQIVSYRHVDELEEKVRPIMLRRNREEVLDLPPKISKYDYVEMLEGQRMLYREVRADIEAHIDEIELSPNPLSKLIRLRQVTGTPELLSKTVVESAKINRLVELVDDIVDGDEKVIVFSNWAEAVKIIGKKLSKHDPLLIWGEIDSYERQQLVNKFQTDDDSKVIVGTVKALGTGVNLTKASHVIFFDSPWTQTDREQAEDRAHRIGSENALEVHHLVTKYTIDERVEEVVEEKGIWSEALVDGKLKDPITRKQLIKRLLME